MRRLPRGHGYELSSGVRPRILVFSHFNGHAMAGFGEGAIKNISIGLGSRSYQLLSLD